jgi:hypothetical protein
LGPLRFIWFMKNISPIFKYVRVLFSADDLKLFLPVSSSLDCSKIQSYLDRLAQWCDDSGLPLKSANAKLCLDLSHLFDSHIRFALQLLTELLRSQTWETCPSGITSTQPLQKDSYTLKTLYVSPIRFRLEYACCGFDSHSTLVTSLESSVFKKSSLNTRIVGLNGTPVLIWHVAR